MQSPTGNIQTNPTNNESKNEWQDLIKHQAQVAKWIEEKEKEIRSYRTRQMG